MTRYAHNTQYPIWAHLWRWLWRTAISITLSLAAGMLGYAYFESLNWVDAFLNASMILGGMGQVDPLHTTGGKIFAGVYALYSGVFLIVCGGFLLVPVFRDVLKKLDRD